MTRDELRMCQINENPYYLDLSSTPIWSEPYFFHKWIEVKNYNGNTNWALVESVDGFMREEPHERIKFTDRPMNDKWLLQWIYDRLVNKYGENPETDYMKRLKTIIDKTKE